MSRTTQLFVGTNCRVRLMKRMTERVAAQVGRFTLCSPIAMTLSLGVLFFFLPPSHPVFLVCWRSWYSGFIYRYLLGVLVPWGSSYPPLRRPSRPQVACTVGACCLLQPGSSPGGPHTPLRSRGCRGKDTFDSSPRSAETESCQFVSA